jgi:hemolysin activation/secretion protein
MKLSLFSSLFIAVSLLHAEDDFSRILISPLYNADSLEQFKQFDAFLTEQENAEKSKSFLKGIYLLCESTFDEIELKEQLENWISQNPVLDSDCLQEIKTRISRYFRDKGYPLITVEIPEQEVIGGIVHVQLIEGKLGKITTRGNRWFPSWMFTDAIRQKAGHRIDTNLLLEDISWLNQNPFHFTDIVFVPGESSGTTDIELLTVDRFPARFYIGADNTGTSLTGTARLFTGVDWAWTFWFDQILSYQFTTSPDFTEFLASNIHYTAYLPWRHTLIIFGGYSSTHPNLSDFHSKGYNGQASLRYQIPLSRLPSDFFLQPLGGYDFKIERSDLLFVGEEQLATPGLAIISQFVGGIDIGWEKDRHKVTGQCLAFFSPGDVLPHQSKEDYSILRPGAKALYFYSKGMLSYRYVNRATLWLQMRLQGSTTPLLPSEEFALGGYDTVRGYKEMVYVSDNALCVNAEIRSPELYFKKKGLDKWIFLWFFDLGWGINDNHSQAEPNSTLLASSGPGLRFAINTYWTLRADYGFKFHKLSSLGDTSIGRFHLGTMVSY